MREKYHLDESSAGVVGREDIEDVVSRWTGVPITSIKEEETQKLLRVEEELHKRVISQDKAIRRWPAPSAARVPGLKNRRIARSVVPVPWARPASARQKWRARWRNSCSAARSR